MISIALIGCGEIGRSILSTIARSPIEGISIDVICCRDSQVQAAHDLCPEATVISCWPDYRGPAVDVVIEAAGQGAVFDLGPAILARGSDLFLLSVGALADMELYNRMLEAARIGNSHIKIPAGALAGFDGLHSLRHSGLESVVYRSSKPPNAWKGTLAEQLIDLSTVASSTVFFRGDARQAALQFPHNANLAAAVALAGVGFERTLIELAVDPDACDNLGQIVATGRAGILKVELSGKGFASNQKTSQVTSMSVVAALASRVALLSFAS